MAVLWEDVWGLCACAGMGAVVCVCVCVVLGDVNIPGTATLTKRVNIFALPSVLRLFGEGVGRAWGWGMGRF